MTGGAALKALTAGGKYLKKTVKKIIDEEPQGTAPAGKSPAEEVVEDTAVEATAEEADFENAGSQEA